MKAMGDDYDPNAAVLELKLRIDEEKDGCSYDVLRRCDDHHDVGSSESDCSGSEHSSDSEPATPRSRYGFFCKCVKVFFLVSFLGVLACVIFKWVGPFFMEKGIIPLIKWERSTFTPPVLACILFTTVALFPTIILPSTPSMWVAGMTFGYGYGFLLIMSAVVFGVSLPYFIGSLIHHKIQGWLQRYPKNASLIRLAGEGGWFDQFRAVALIRISPFPYILYNYCAVATSVKYGPYILGSILGMVPDVLVAIYTGILIKTLADASGTHHSLSAQEIIVNVVGFSITVATAVICTIFAKRRLKDMPIEEEPLLQ